MPYYLFTVFLPLAILIMAPNIKGLMVACFVHSYLSFPQRIIFPMSGLQLLQQSRRFASEQDGYDD
jgi:hypothetical protein